MTDRENKIAIIKRDRLGLFKNLPERPNTLRSADGLNLAERRFEDINRFYEEYGREPSSESDDPSEIEVAGYLESFRGRPQDFPSLIRLDRHCLLQPKAADNSVAKPERIIARLLKMSPEVFIFYKNRNVIITAFICKLLDRIGLCVFRQNDELCLPAPDRLLRRKASGGDPSGSGRDPEKRKDSILHGHLRSVHPGCPEPLH